MVALMVGIALVSIVIATPVPLKYGATVSYVIEANLTLLTSAIPPALPAALSCGVIVAMSQLTRKGIYTTSPNRINLAGQVQTFVFDKTGTLTEDGLSVLGVRPTVAPVFNLRAKFGDFTKDPRIALCHQKSQHDALLMEAMAACTAVAYIDGTLVGDPLDVQMF